jgi:hypothetical protein
MPGFPITAGYVVWELRIMGISVVRCARLSSGKSEVLSND